jgi:hypothetical protein
MTVTKSEYRDRDKDVFDICGIKRSEIYTLIEVLQDKIADKKTWTRKPYTALLGNLVVALNDEE